MNHSCTMGSIFVDCVVEKDTINPPPTLDFPSRNRPAMQGIGNRLLDRTSGRWRTQRRGPTASNKTRARANGTKGTDEERVAFAQSAFCRWLEQQGVAWTDQKDRSGDPSVYISSFRRDDKQGTRGLAAGKRCHVGEVILTVPGTCCFPPAQRLQATSLPEKTHWGCRFAVALLQEMELGERGRFWDYLQILPEEVLIPPDFSWDVLQQIQYLPGYDQISTYQHLVSSWYKKLQDVLPAETSMGQWRWANAVCHSRTFKLGQERTMIPLVDLINHSFLLQNVDWRQGSNGQIEIIALHEIEEHQQLYLSYGEKGSDHYFVFYGFVPDRNSFEDVVLFECVEDAVAWYMENFACGLSRELQEVARADGLLAAKGLDGCDGGGESADRLLATISGEVDARMLGAFESLHTSTQGPSALECLYTRCQELLSSLSTTLDEDVQTLMGRDLDAEMRVVLQYRASKKHLLSSLQDLLQHEMRVGFDTL